MVDVKVGCLGGDVREVTVLAPTAGPVADPLAK
jgi:hypothetical protein